MSIKSKVIAAAAAVTLIGGTGAAGTLTASAATPSCGGSCIDIFSSEFGNYTGPNFVMDVLRQSAKVGQPVILFRASQDDPAEDFTISFQGQVSDFYAAGLVSSAVDLHYGAGIGLTGTPPGGNGFPDDPAFEFEYAPYGVNSGLCAGVFSTAAKGTKVNLEPCGTSSKTVWIGDSLDYSIFSAGVPLINGSDTNFSHPFVMTYPGGYPTDVPRPQMFTANLTGFSNGGGPVLGSVSDRQLWEAITGVLP